MAKATAEDDGIGFDVRSARIQGSGEDGFGSFNIRKRLDYAGGNLVAESHSGGGR